MSPKVPAKAEKAKPKAKNKRQKLNLKGWLKTSADWARFEAWAKINAQPRKIPEPEPTVRPSKPLSQLKKRILVLAIPHKKQDPSKICRLNLSVSKAALQVKPSKRIKSLARPRFYEVEHCREFPIKISKAALLYEASPRIIEISQPRIYEPEECRVLEISESALKHKPTPREERLALAKKIVECPHGLTEEEMTILMTPWGIRRSALMYKSTPWVKFLAMPSYRFLKDRNDRKARQWKKMILDESETRGKKAFEEKREKERRELLKKKAEEKKEGAESAEKGDQKKDALNAKKETVDEEKKKAGEGDAMEEKEEEKVEEAGEEEKTKNADDTAEDADAAETADTPEKTADKEETGDSHVKENEGEEAVETVNLGEGHTKTALSAKSAKNRTTKPAEEKKSEADGEKEKKRKAERNAWRFMPTPCKDKPFKISKAALSTTASARMNDLATPLKHDSKSCRENPFKVKKSALNYQASPRVTELSKPQSPRDPVQRTPPRQKDDFGRPIFPMPVYGKILPQVKPIKLRQCNDKEDIKQPDEKEEEIDPIVFEPTIDPCIDLARARRQKKARKAAIPIIKRQTERRRKERQEKKSEAKKIALQKSSKKGRVKTATSSLSSSEQKETPFTIPSDDLEA
ncbi:DNA ligase 1 [Orussus abietinus]|uniref:DNA ligase 1 n=1 Tax=Orussus abietinus TaxID=222816 RepID=UPI000626D548|nr:DNA ligase 1 [Orussus abietinus]